MTMDKLKAILSSPASPTTTVFYNWRVIADVHWIEWVSEIILDRQTQLGVSIWNANTVSKTWGQGEIDQPFIGIS